MIERASRGEKMRCPSEAWQAAEACLIDAQWLARGESEIVFQEAGDQRLECPDSLVEQMAQVPVEIRGAHPDMIPDRWAKSSEPTDDISVRVLQRPYVFGGKITERRATRHREGQLLLTRDFKLIRASYGVMDGARTLPADVLEDLAGQPDRYTLRRFGQARQLDGVHYFLGSIHRHFGHCLLEGLARLWALRFLAPDVRQHLRYLVYEDTLPRFALELLAMLGIEKERLVHAGRLAQVETLIVPDVSARTHRWISPLQAWTYQRIAAHGQPRAAGKQVFLSRRQVPDRPLDNIDEIEAAFARSGYEIVCPETLPLVQQVALAANASHMAGCVGSQMYLAAFQPTGARNLVLAPRNFYLKDDLLLAHCRGHSLQVVFGGAVDHALPKEQRRWRCELSGALSRLIDCPPEP